MRQIADSLACPLGPSPNPDFPQENRVSSISKRSRRSPRGADPPTLQVRRGGAESIHPPSSAFRPPSSVLRPPPSVFRLLPSAFRSLPHTALLTQVANHAPPFYAKQTQFSKPQNQHNPLCRRGLRRKTTPTRPKKQTQSNPIRFPLPASRPTLPPVCYTIQNPKKRTSVTTPVCRK